MRKSILLPLLVMACGDDPSAGHRVIRDFHTLATPVACEAVDLGAVAVEELRLATDSTFLVLDAAQHRVTEYGDDLLPRWSLDYPEAGPGAVDRPVSAALLGDTAIAIAARGGLRLVVLDRAGRLIRAQRLPFMPGALAATGDGAVLISAVPLGATPGSLLFRYRDGTLEELSVPRRPYADMTIGALGNTTRVEPLPPSSALVVHQFLAPRALEVVLETGRVIPRPVPTPDGTADRIDFVPDPPINDAQLGEILAPAMAVSVDPAGDVFLLTRSGRWARGRRERAILRLDRDLEFLAAHTVDVHAIQMAVLPRRAAALVADDTDRFFLCPLHAPARGE